MNKFEEIWSQLENEISEPIKSLEGYPDRSYLNISMPLGVYKCQLDRNNKTESILVLQDKMITIIYLNNSADVIQISYHSSTDSAWGDIISEDDFKKMMAKYLDQENGSTAKRSDGSTSD